MTSKKFDCDRKLISVNALFLYHNIEKLTFVKYFGSEAFDSTFMYVA
mgnify:CR=1 FL=1